MALKYVDTDVLIYWATDHPRHGETATRLLRHIELNEKGCTSALSVYLFDSVLANAGIEAYDLADFLDEVDRIRNLKVESVTTKTYTKAAAVRRELDVPLDVAVGMVVAQDKKADTVLSQNPAWDKGPLPRRFEGVA